MLTEKMPKNAICFECKICDFKCIKNSNYIKHLATDKHKRLTHVDKMFPEIHKNSDYFIEKCYKCDCGKEYSHRQSLSLHKKKCKSKEEVQHKIPIISQEMVMEILKQNDDLKNLLMDQNKQMMEQSHDVKDIMEQNNEFKGMMMEICKNGINNTNNTNCHNKTFNLQFFLNEQCKDAMNMVDFVNSLQLTLQDAENVGKLGYVRGISNIIIDNLKALDIYKRPIHCTDTKRDVMYVKDDNKWEKETEEFKTIRKLIKSVTFKNGKNIRLFKTKHPCCGTGESMYSDQYSKMYIEGFGGTGTDRDNETKIIKRMAKEIIIDR